MSTDDHAPTDHVHTADGVEVHYLGSAASARDVRLHLAEHHAQETRGLAYQALVDWHGARDLVTAGSVPAGPARRRRDETQATTDTRPCCAECHRRFEPATTGRPPKYCSTLCRKAAHRRRQRAEEARAAAETAERQRLEREHLLATVAAQLVDRCTANPGLVATAIVEWVKRGEARYYHESRQEALYSLERAVSRAGPLSLGFVLARSAGPAGDGT